MMIYPLLSVSLPSEIRVNDCYGFTLRATNIHGEDVREEGESRIEFEIPASAKLYSSQLGCRTYNEAEAIQSVTLDLNGVAPTLYLRVDSPGSFTLTARASGGVGLTDANLSLSAQSQSFTAMDSFDQFNAGVFKAANGKTYAIGDFLTWGTTGAAGGILRLDSSLELDRAFSVGVGFNFPPTTMALQSDGRVLVGGPFTSFNGTNRQYLVRLKSDGTLDASFQLAGSGFDSTFSALELQADGKVIVGGNFFSYNGTPRSRLARLHADGSLDTSFVVGSGFDADVQGVALNPNGSMIVSGFFADYNGTGANYVAKINADGSLDPSFSLTGAGFDAPPNYFFLQSDGRAIFVGPFAFYDATPINTIVRLLTDGSLDGSFALTGTGFDSIPGTYSLAPDGKILVGGSFSTYDSVSRKYIARLNSNGTLDTSFAVTGTGFNAQISAISLQSDGKILVAGPFTAYNGIPRPHIARLNSDGSLDLSFDPGHGGLDDGAFALSQSADGRAVVGGGFATFDGTARPFLARVNTDGSLDTGFSSTGMGFNGQVYSLAHQSDGKIVVGGVFSAYDGTARGRIARLRDSGELDTTFAAPGSGFNANITHLEVLSDGKILASGPFTDFNGTARQSVARVLSDGNLDTSFVLTGTGFNPNVVSLVDQPDGKIVVVGAFTLYNGTSRPYIARLLSNGSLDTTFVTTGSGFSGAASAVDLQSDGKVLVAGSFTSYNGTSVGRVARLNSDGSLDPSFFGSATGANSSVAGVTVLSDGKILILGSFTAYNGVPRKHLARLNSDGTLDSDFVDVGFLGGAPTIVELTSESKWLVAGWFTSNGQRKLPRLARLTYNGTVD